MRRPFYRLMSAFHLDQRREERGGKSILTILNPSTSASLIQVSISSATEAGVPTGVKPRPPTQIYSASVFLVHFLGVVEVEDPAPEDGAWFVRLVM